MGMRFKVGFEEQSGEVNWAGDISNEKQKCIEYMIIWESEFRKFYVTWNQLFIRLYLGSYKS